MLFAADFFKNIFSSPGVATPAPSTHSKRKHRRNRHKPNTDQTPRNNTNGPGNDLGEIDINNTSNLGTQSPALALELSIQEQLEDEVSEQIMNEERYRSTSPSPSPQLKGKQKKADEGSHRRQPLGDHDLEDLSSVGATTVNNTAENPYNKGDQLSERAWRRLSNHEAWDLSSNRKALDLVREAESSGLDPKILISHSIREPEYALRDIEFRDGLWQLMDKMEQFGKAHFAFDIEEDKDDAALTNMFGSMSMKTVKVIGCVASGGPEGEKGWHSLFYDEEKRQALVCAIIGNVVSEQVFQHIFFGGEPEEIKAVAKLQQEYQAEDGKFFYISMFEYLLTIVGFVRTAHYAATVQHIISKREELPSLPSNFANHANYITAAILQHLRPIYSLHKKKSLPQSLIQSLYAIVAHSGMLSLLMRLDEHTTYTFMPVLKEVHFDTTRMECFNSASLKTTSSEGNKVTQIVIIPGVTAFRRGGWETGESWLSQLDYEDNCEDRGIRERIITHGWVFCRRGKPRTVGLGADEGFVEFFPGVQGVKDPTGKGSKARVNRKRKGMA